MVFKIDISQSIRQLITLKRRMKIDDHYYGTLRAISYAEQEQLQTTGISVRLDELIKGNIDASTDYTLIYKGQRIILYIGDISYKKYISHSQKDPRFHLAMCCTLKEMLNQGREHRYIISQREDGLFPLYSEGQIFDYKKLKVCQNCLSLLNYHGFKFSDKVNKEMIVELFSLTDFFIQYPKPAHTIQGYYQKYYPASYNQYPPYWATLCTKIKEESHYICDDCRVDLSDPSYRKFLHVHHKDGNKSNCLRSNLTVLCIRCHAYQFNHSHIFQLSDYQEFIKIFSSIS